MVRLARAGKDDFVNRFGEDFKMRGFDMQKLVKQILGVNLNKEQASLATINLGVTLVMFLVAGAMLFFLPEQMSFWSSNGVDYTVPSVFGVWALPLLALVFNIILILQKRMSRVHCFMFLGYLVIMVVAYAMMM